MSVPRDQSLFYIGDMANLGTFTRRHFARQDDIRSRYFAPDPDSRYPEISNVIYAERLGGLILQPDWSLADLSYTSLTVNVGGADTRDCTPPKLGVVCPMYRNATANGAPAVDTWDIQGGLLSAAPSIIFHLIRSKAPPDGQTPESQRWTLSFGGLVLTWGRYTDPVLTTDAGAEVARYTIREGDRERWAMDTLQRWEIASLGGELYLSCSGYSGDWTVVYPTLPAANWRFRANGGVTACHLKAVTFASSGYLITPWIEEGFAYPDGDLEATVWPSNTGSVTAALTVEAVSGTAKKYRLALTTSDTRQTPIARRFQSFYEADFAALIPSYTEITDHFVKGRESLTQDYSARSTSLTFRENADFIAAVGRLSGHRVVTYSTGYDVGDGVPVQQARMVGIMRAVERDGHDITLHVYDEYTKLAGVKLFDMPCLWGRNRGEAIALIARCAGVHDTRININADVTGVIGDPTQPFSADGPRWVIEDGTSAADAITKVCKTYGIRADFGGDGILYIYQSDSTIITNDYSSDVGTSDVYGLGTNPFEGVAFRSELAGAVNHVVIIGKDRGGQPIVASRYDPDSLADPNSERYVGYYATEVEKNDDLGTTGEVETAAARRLQDIDYGLPSVRLDNNRALALCHQAPREYIRVTDSDIDFNLRTCKILQMDVEIDELDTPVTSMLLEVWPV